MNERREYRFSHVTALLLSLSFLSSAGAIKEIWI